MDFGNMSHLLQAVFIALCAVAMILGIKSGQTR